MIDAELALSLLTAHGVALIAPLALIEGPIITVVAAWLAQQSLLDVKAVFLTVMAADLVGDALLYLLGRLGGRRVMRLLRVGEHRVEALAERLRRNAAGVIVAGKLTHAAGAAVLFAAGAARVPFWWFMLCNFAAAVPKTLVFIMLGWWFGEAYAEMGGWIILLSLGLLALAILTIYLLRRGRA